MGNPMRLPIPFSVFACFGGLLLFKNYERSNLALYILFFFFIVMLVTTIISTKDNLSELRNKFILLIQFVLPMFSLVLGQIYGLNEFDSKIFEKTAAGVLSILIPVQLLSTWYAGTTVLSPYIYFFSIYQQLQYVPTILTCLYLYAFYSLWQHYIYQKALIVLAPLMGVYVILSGSILTVIVLISGLFLFTYLSWKHASDKTPAFILFTVVCVLGMSIILLEGVGNPGKGFINKYDVNLSNRVIIDNSFKVGLRQPYPGIITFFLWGLLLSRLSPMPSGAPIYGD